ncbi:MAG: nitrilase-related carbon-nitrogen hydrolase [Saprospiraceae bacterium]
MAGNPAYHWQAFIGRRAIENQSYTVGVNRVGTDENGLVIQDTCLIDYSGQTLYHALGAEDVFTCTLDRKDLAAFRHKLNFLSDQDKFKILPF